MLTKEYRIPLPLSLDEYRIAQLYMIQKKSRLESTGSGSAVEIIENRPYENGPGGSGQYTKKIYHIGSHLPGWLKALLPKTALRVEEEAWNAYPYTKTRHTCPFIEKFFIDIETYYLDDYGQTENVFNLSSSERKNCEIDFIDPIKDNFPPKDYKKEEDPRIFVSSKTKRGPLSDDWLEAYKDGSNTAPVMCAYKLIKVEFKYWGMQSKIENFIQSGLRNPIMVGHRQAWSWQDEWFGLTIEDIRELEKQTQLELSKRMDLMSESENNTDNNKVSDREESHSAAHSTETCGSDVDNNSERVVLSSKAMLPSSVTSSSSYMHRNSSIQAITNQERLLEIHMKHIEQLESDDGIDDDDDNDTNSLYFDALDYFEDTPSTSTSASMEHRNHYHYPNHDQQHQHYDRTSTLMNADEGGEVANIKNKKQPDSEHGIVSPTINISSEEHFSYSPRLQALVFIIQAGSVSDFNTDSESRLRDFQTFERLFTNTCNNCYPGARDTVLFEVIECASLTKDIMRQLMELHVDSREGHLKMEDSENLSNSFPFSVIPLLMFHHPEFQTIANGLVDTINMKYDQLQGVLNENRCEVYFICDSVGGLFAFQALCQYSSRDDASSSSSNYEDDDTTSIDSVPSSLNFHFKINGVFTLGSPVGMVALKQKLSVDKDFSQPRCGQLYNLFHSFDPISSRLEPIIDDSFANIRPAPVPRSNSFPFNDDIQYNASVLYDNPSQSAASPTATATAATAEEAAETSADSMNLLSSHDKVDRKASSNSVSSIARKSAYNDKAFCKSKRSRPASSRR